jgi:hypothetical protein
VTSDLVIVPKPSDNQAVIKCTASNEATSVPLETPVILTVYCKYLPNKSHFLPCDSVRHLSQDICPPISQIVLKNFIKNSFIIKECPEEILINLAIVLKISKSI